MAVSKLVGPWDGELRATYAERITAELDEAGIIVHPPLAECGPDTVIHLRLVELEVLYESEVSKSADQPVIEEPPPEEPEPVHAHLAQRRRLRGSPADRRVPPVLRSARAMGSAATCLVVLLVVVVISSGGSDDKSPSSPALSGPDSAQTRFCDSKAGRALTDAEYLALERPEHLTRATERVLRSARSAPAGADCAVLALNTLADRWAKSADRERARTEVQRIRTFQRRAQLTRPII